MAKGISFSAWEGRVVKAATPLALLAVIALASGSASLSSAPRRASSAKNTSLVVEGRAAFERNCAACHGKGPSEGRVPLLPGTFALSLKYRGGELPAALEDRTDLSPELIELVVRNGIFSMPPLRKTEVSDQELKAIAAYFTISSKTPNGPIMTGPNKAMTGKVN